jgi:hypothetical protein
MKKFMLGTTLLALAGGAGYHFGHIEPPSNTPTPLPCTPLVVPTIAPLRPADDLAFDNPTAILLGESNVPEGALRGPVSPAEGLIVPEIVKR